MIRWEKQGLIFNPHETGLPWMVHHAYSPVVIQMDNSIWRCYFAGRNEKNNASVGYFDIDLNEPKKILYYSIAPVLEKGAIGTYDCDGIIPASIIEKNGELYMFYSGWNRGWKHPLFRSSIGLAISRDGGNSFYRYSEAPIFDRNDKDPITVMAPCVYKINDEYIMNYSSLDRWEEKEEEFFSWYYTKMATSNDAITWEASGKIVIPFKKGENHIARMCVVPIKGKYEGWYCYMDECVGQYRIGVAFSDDGKKWIRKDEEAGMTLSATGWDSEAQAYPYVIIWNNKRYMFYNGNKFGIDGIGLAIEK